MIRGGGGESTGDDIGKLEWYQVSRLVDISYKSKGKHWHSIDSAMARIPRLAGHPQ